MRNTLSWILLVVAVLDIAFLVYMLKKSSRNRKSEFQTGNVPPAVQLIPEKIEEIMRSKKSEEFLNYAEFWKRFFAFLIDEFVTSGIAFVCLWTAYSPQSFMRIYFLLIIFRWIYFAGMESSPKQATIGKMIFGLVVTDRKGSKISFVRATLRYFSKILSQELYYSGYVMVLATEKKQGLHDKIAGTLVLTKDRSLPHEYNPFSAALESS